MLEPDLAKPRRRTTTGGAVAGLAVLALAASVLPAHGLSGQAVVQTRIAAPQAAAEPEPTVLRELSVPTLSARPAGKRATAVVAELPATRTSPYAMVGVTWTAGTSAPGTFVEVATRTDGTWSEYAELEVEDDVDLAQAAERTGTEPLWVGEGDGVAVRVVSPTGAAPDDVQVAMVEPDRTVASSAKTTGAGAGARIVGPVTFPEMPEVVTRDEWGADPGLGDACFAPRYGRSARAVVVHHTVNSNDYSRRDAPAIVRSILAYHTQGQGWCDIGYNFLVDRFGRIYQGRKGGMRRPVRGAHAGDYNTDTVGVSMIGDYDKVRPSRRMKNAMVRLIGWRLGTSYAPVFGRTRIYDRRLPRIMAHGLVMSTACPGRYGYALLPTLRSRVNDYLSSYRSPIRKRAAQLGRRTTGRVWLGETEKRDGFVTTFEKGAMLLKPGLGPHWLFGRMLGAYRHFGGIRTLGFPLADVEPTVAEGVTSMRFEHGRLYKVGARRPRLLYGRVLLSWQKLGGVAGSLGAPTSSVSSTPTRDTAAFQNGRITWNKTDNTITVEEG